MEVWRLDHPDHGLIEVRTGFDREFLAEDPDWPGEIPDNFKDRPDAGVPVPVDGSVKERVRAFRNNPPVRLEVRVAGTVQERYSDPASGRIPLFGTPGDGVLSSMTASFPKRSEPHLKLTVSRFNELLEVDYRDADTVVEFEPPPGSRGEKRRRAMQSSAFKRVAIPIATGLGKGGWALLMLLLIPILTRLLDYLPDWKLPSPPHLDLPVPALPQLHLPTIRWPDWEFKLPPLPDWVRFLLEYTKIWVPVVIGIVAGLVALRNHRRSERQKRDWDERSTKETKE